MRLEAALQLSSVIKKRGLIFRVGGRVTSLQRLWRTWTSSSTLRGIMEAIQLVAKSAFATRSGAVFVPAEAIQLVLKNAFAVHSGADPSYSRLPSKFWKSSLELW